MRLIICEKEAAAKRIAEILSDGKCVSDKKYEVPYYTFKNHCVVGLKGHVLRVDFPDSYSSWSNVSLVSLSKAELLYVPEKLDIIKLVKSLAKKASEVVIATDYDTEGESIGLEAVRVVSEVVKIPVKRMRFSAIIKEDIIDSYDNLGELDFNLASAADARREIDLIWGAVLTRFLSVVTGRLGSNFLSAGRVQSPTLSIIVEREKERLAFKPVPFWEFPLAVKKGKSKFVAHYEVKQVFDESLKNKLVELKPSLVNVSDVIVKKRVSKPPIPFNTTSLLRAAASIGFSSMSSMRVAESLYLKGLISYPRTDNEVYPKSLKVKKILDSFKGTSYDSCLDYLKPDLIPTAGPKESKDHPPIHPTGLRPEGLDDRELKLYDLVVRRFIATFSTDCFEELTKVSLDVDGFVFVADGFRIVKPGWRAVYVFAHKDDNLLPEIVKGESLKVISFDCVDRETQPPNRYGHGGIIKIMNDLNIGTKSTRPGIIQKLIERYYLFHSKSLTPTPIAMAVTSALDDYANLITEPSMTRELEDDMDLISQGKLSKESVVNVSRDLLIKALDVLSANKDNIAKSIIDGIRKSQIVGSCPVCGSNLVFISARKRFVGCTGYPKCSNSYPLPQHGLVQVTNDKCPSCGLNKVILIRKGKRPFIFCPNIDCPSRDGDEDTKKLREARDNYLKSKSIK